MRHLLYILTIATILHACNNVSNKKLTVPNGVKTDYNTEAVISQSLHISVPENKFSGYNSIFLLKNKYFYGVNNSCLNVIDVYDIQNQSYIQDPLIRKFWMTGFPDCMYPLLTVYIFVRSILIIYT